MIVQPNLFLPIPASTILPAAASAVAAAIAKILDDLVHRIRNGSNYYQKCNYLLPHNHLKSKTPNLSPTPLPTPR